MGRYRRVRLAAINSHILQRVNHHGPSNNHAFDQAQPASRNRRRLLGSGAGILAFIHTARAVVREAPQAAPRKIEGGKASRKIEETRRLADWNFSHLERVLTPFKLVRRQFSFDRFAQPVRPIHFIAPRPCCNQSFQIMHGSLESV